MDAMSSSYNYVFMWAFAVACLAIVGLRPIAANVGLVDRPNARKKHLGDVPLIGGIAIYFTMLIVSQVFLEKSQLVNLYMISCSFMVLIGALDDFYDVSAKLRLLAQLLIASILVLGAGHALYDMGNILGLGNVNLGIVAIPVTLLAVATAINAFNMTDGIDGLVGFLGIVTFSSLCILFYWANNQELFVMSAIFVAALSAFLLFNLGGLRRIFGKIFMGDAGSMMIGLTVVWLLVLGTQNGEASFRPVTALWIIAVPLMDMFAVMHRRVKKGKSPLSADRDHLHHICIRFGFSSKSSLTIITFFAMLFAGFGLLGEHYKIHEGIMMLSFIVVFIIYDYAFIHIWKISRLLRRYKRRL
ncbi:UDP-N-acetylglucosamine--undecaprenyl-phosphate N-acetylglucosaminephosphotransferase [Paraglaciecola aquimarina]|uniref:Undecaprenyl-phosphate alpha-N-acetylglucosaminyl 1-phosphate transferase n=1 Tax=Paraglaciecola aquimarina TaxID=1235557 RepID=A0ABU3T1G5_9ALTE|nr:UDP-N-acetylglucosamine--undecaprenyl-phosphate N-acetylglucosaminephosphotransferase [Paraglaciecola aquimarina]MDU0356103.1 UDP-N-acetylglucosamine--undecaprenyl-phosphate N-acetylglucosaminephosphotransferase [Paraglaciecola aquimarina]